MQARPARATAAHTLRARPCGRAHSPAGCGSVRIHRLLAVVFSIFLWFGLDRTSNCNSGGGATAGRHFNLPLSPPPPPLPCPHSRGDRGDWTALQHFARYHGDEKTVNFLLRHGAIDAGGVKIQDNPQNVPRSRSRSRLGLRLRSR